LLAGIRTILARKNSLRTISRRKRAQRGAFQNLDQGRLKYYIHDQVRLFRLQLLGSLTASDLPELEGCWKTAQSSIAGRKIQVDISQLIAADERGRAWLAQMADTPNLDFLGSPASAGLLPAGAASEIVASPAIAPSGNWLVRALEAISGKRKQQPSGETTTEGAHAIALDLSSSKTEISAS
jgi:hypothetical protein